jgi:hypothetical protein
MRLSTPSLITIAAALGAAPALAADYGGQPSSAIPRPESVSCSQDCAALDAARAGSTIRVYGRDLGDVARVVFLGARGAGDDISVKSAKSRSHTVYAKVPAAAASGPLVLVNADGNGSQPTPRLEIDRGPTTLAKPGTAPPVDAKVAARRAFFAARRPAGLDYLVKGSAPVQVSVSLVRAGGDTVVARWSPGLVEPGRVRHIRWDGMERGSRKSAAQGRYEFRVYTAAKGARSSATAKPTAARSFLFLDHRFPVQGRHHYGDKGARFGAARYGHTHQGQDVLADCGLPLIAARGGRVKFRGYQGNAGNYVVIDGQATGIDYAYMHLRTPARYRKGALVRTGDLLGQVGATGDATACHLHFEEWASPGWYSGGRPFDPLPDLRAWDRYS